MKNLFRLIILGAIMGFIYFLMEMVYRGRSSIHMIWVASICSIFIGLINEKPSFYNRKIWEQCIIGTIFTLIIEYYSGWLLNIKLGLSIWDYSDLPFNINGQVSLYFSVAWFLICPFTIWTDDYLRFRLFSEEKCDNLGVYYKNLFTNK